MKRGILIADAGLAEPTADWRRARQASGLASGGEPLANFRDTAPSIHTSQLI
jgi:hypothetical protein